METMTKVEKLHEWYVEQYIRSTCLWVYVKGSSGSIEHANHIVKLLAARGIQARVRLKR